MGFLGVDVGKDGAADRRPEGDVAFERRSSQMRPRPIDEEASGVSLLVPGRIHLNSHDADTGRRDGPSPPPLQRSASSGSVESRMTGRTMRGEERLRVTEKCAPTTENPQPVVIQTALQQVPHIVTKWPWVK